MHKLRSSLAILGILIGVTAVIWLVAMGEGVSYQAQQQIKELGANNIIVRNVKPPQDSSSNQRGFFSVTEYGLLRDDYKRIVNTIPTIKQAVPLREISKEARFLGRTTPVRIVACTPDYRELNNLRVEQGRFLTDSDKANNVAVIAHGA